jgi:hypothetical protein
MAVIADRKKPMMDEMHFNRKEKNHFSQKLFSQNERKELSKTTNVEEETTAKR